MQHFDMFVLDEVSSLQPRENVGGIATIARYVLAYATDPPGSFDETQTPDSLRIGLSENACFAMPVSDFR